MSFLVTAMISLLYSLLGSYSDGLLVLRIELTAIGAASGLIAALLVLPARTRRRTDQQLAEVLHRMRTVIAWAVAQLTGGFPPVRSTPRGNWTPRSTSSAPRCNRSSTRPARSARGATAPATFWACSKPAPTTHVASPRLLSRCPVPHTTNHVDRFEPGQKFGQTLRIIPGRPQHDSVKTRPVHVRVVPIDNFDRHPSPLQLGQRQRLVLVPTPGLPGRHPRQPFNHPGMIYRARL